ncbi:trypsin-like peptidase domain-containing protein [Candidatus Uhrbacteria bacterium]|nr:trypsin-like peptidase domain-containing protein [Candidatus Uhrbacteria bacterium]
MFESKKQLSTLMIGFIGGVFGGLVAGSALLAPAPGAAPAPTPTIEKPPAIVSSDTDRVVEDVVSRASPSVISIQIRKKGSERRTVVTPFNDFFTSPFGSPFFFQEVEPQPGSENDAPNQERIVGGGTGFIVSEDGLVLTNKHVIGDQSARYIAVLSSGESKDLTVVAVDPINDLAVARLPEGKYPALPLGDSGVIRIGQTVIAIGNTLSQYQNTVTKGVISGLGRRIVAGSQLGGGSEVIEQALQTDAAINPGNSGGPLLTLDGAVIGINTAINQGGQSIGFAIPSNLAKQVLESVQKYGRIVRPWVGVRYLLIDKDFAAVKRLAVDHGAYISRGAEGQDLAVVPGSPADKAGLKEGDVIVSVNGKDVTTQSPLGSMIAQFQPGDRVTFKVMRGDNIMEVKVELGEFKQ